MPLLILFPIAIYAAYYVNYASFPSFSYFFMLFESFRVILNEGMTLGMTLRSGPESRSSLVRMHPLDGQKPVELTNTDAVAT